MAVMKKPRTHYDNLQVAETASPEVIRRAYKVLSQRWHPDKNPQQRDKAERICIMLNEAYAVLSDPVRRAKHDRWITLQRAAAAKQAEHQRQAAQELARVAKRYSTIGQSGAEAASPKSAKPVKPAKIINLEHKLPPLRAATTTRSRSSAQRQRQLLTLMLGAGLIALLYFWPAVDPYYSPPPTEPVVNPEDALATLPSLADDPPQPSDQDDPFSDDPLPIIVESLTTTAPPLIAERYRVYGAAEDRIEDTQTGLYWMRCSVGQEWDGETCVGNAQLYTWEQAWQLAAERPTKRLPHIEELRTLVYCSSGYPTVFNTGHNVACSGDYQRPTVVSDAFPNTPAAAFWASPFSGDSERAWFTFFYSGHSSTGAKTSHFRVRFVYEKEWVNYSDY